LQIRSVNARFFFFFSSIPYQTPCFPFLIRFFSRLGATDLTEPTHSRFLAFSFFSLHITPLFFPFPVHRKGTPTFALHQLSPPFSDLRFSFITQDFSLPDIPPSPPVRNSSTTEHNRSNRSAFMTTRKYIFSPLLL